MGSRARLDELSERAGVADTGISSSSRAPGLGVSDGLPCEGGACDAGGRGTGRVGTGKEAVPIHLCEEETGSADTRNGRHQGDRQGNVVFLARFYGGVRSQCANLVVKGGYNGWNDGTARIGHASSFLTAGVTPSLSVKTMRYWPVRLMICSGIPAHSRCFGLSSLI